MILQKIQTIVTSTTMVGVWCNLYLNYKNNKEDTEETK